jgi:predicted DNA-binding antitoxin AbrB/MazE fold protein
MGQTVRAIYEQGQLRLLDNVALAEGQEVNVSIHSDMEIARLLLRDILVPTPIRRRGSDEVAEEALLREIQAELTADLRLSDAIIEERREGP